MPKVSEENDVIHSITYSFYSVSGFVRSFDNHVEMNMILTLLLYILTQSIIQIFRLYNPIAEMEVLSPI